MIFICMKNTYIYVKESPKGMFYLGKTELEPYSYMGSGKKWLDHLKKYNYTKKDIKTYILYNTEIPSDLKTMGLYYSKLFNVVENKRWANLVNEEGSGGGTMLGKKHKKSTKKLIAISKIGNNNPMKRQEVVQKAKKSREEYRPTEETKEKTRKSLLGRKRPIEVVEKIRLGLLGKKLSPDHIESLKGKRTPYGEQPKIKCIHCGLEGGKNSINRWHNDNCKHKN